MRRCWPLLLAIGCAAPAVRPEPVVVPRAAEPVTPALPAGPLDLPALEALALAHHPDLALAAARAAEARGEVVQAGLYPNPTVGYVGSEINQGPGTPGQQGAYVAQEIVTGGKRRVAREAARWGATAADWQAQTRYFDVTARVRTAYYEYQTARAVLAASEAIVRQFEDGLAKAEALAKAGTLLGYEVPRFRIELTQAKNRAGAARERLAAAERRLAAAAGVPALPGPVPEQPLDAAAPALDFDRAVAASEDSSSVQEARAALERARVEVVRAGLQPIPDLQLQAGVQYDYALGAPIANAQAGVKLPLFDRNQGNILAAQARQAAAAAALEQARLRLRERLADAFQRYHNARRQAELTRTQILPDARAALARVEPVYEARGERFFETLDARRVLAQAEIDYRQALGELWQAASEIEAITQAAR